MREISHFCMAADAGDLSSSVIMPLLSQAIHLVARHVVRVITSSILHEPTTCFPASHVLLSNAGKGFQTTPGKRRPQIWIHPCTLTGTVKTA